jgi:hypothetical protein
MVLKKTTSPIFSSPCAAFHAAGGTMISEGKGINELSMDINKVIVP